MKNEDIKKKILELENGGALKADEQMTLLKDLLRANRRILALRERTGDYQSAASKKRAEEDASVDEN